MHFRKTLAVTALYVIAGGAAEAAPTLAVTVDQIANGQPIPAKFSLCRPTEDGKSTASDNLRPEISWVGAPSNTKSFTIIMHDPDVPQDFSKAGKEGMVVAADAPRKDFYHWGLADIPAKTTRIPGGKPDGKIKPGVRLVNDLGAYMPDAKNYGGPCPPWNDARLHHYHFTVYALDIDSLKLEDEASVRDAVDALKNNKHIVAKGEVVGTYTLNANLPAKQ